MSIQESSIKEITNFFDNPDLVRKNGLNQRYQPWNKYVHEKSIWSGYRSDINDDSIQTEITSKIEKSFGRKILRILPLYHVNPWVSRQGFPHIDNKNINAFAGVIYLNEDWQLPVHDKITDFGTTIYDEPNVHDFIIDNDKMRIMYETNLYEDNRFKDIFSEELTFLKSTLKIYKKVKFEYNKLICYPGNLLHSPDFYFGNDVNNSRMTIAFHGEFHAE